MTESAIERYWRERERDVAARAVFPDEYTLAGCIAASGEVCFEIVVRWPGMLARNLMHAAALCRAHDLCRFDRYLSAVEMRATQWWPGCGRPA